VNDQDESKKQFEEWWDDDESVGGNVSLQNAIREIAWEAWQASRSHLEDKP
jgi:hypothetical protein